MTDHSLEIDLLVVGGLTVDVFPDGTAAPGGSVIHAGAAVVAAGLRQATLTVAGDEPAAQGGLQRLASFGGLIHQPSSSTTTYRHGDRDGVRVLVFERGTDPIHPDAVDRSPRPRVAVVAPIGDEVPERTLRRVLDRLAPQVTVVLIQGWLRRLRPGREVEPRPLDEVPDGLWRAFGDADAVVLSTEDLAGPATDPFVQAAAVRHRIGPRPVLVVTLGVQGYLLDDPASERVIASLPRTVVRGVSTVGAGDTFGAALAVNLGRGEDAAAAAGAATERVIEVLESRR